MAGKTEKVFTETIEQNSTESQSVLPLKLAEPSTPLVAKGFDPSQEPATSGKRHRHRRPKPGDIATIGGEVCIVGFRDPDFDRYSLLRTNGGLTAYLDKSRLGDRQPATPESLGKLLLTYAHLPKAFVWPAAVHDRELLEAAIAIVTKADSTKGWQVRQGLKSCQLGSMEGPQS